MPYIELDGSQLYYRALGQGAPLLLLHAGWGLAINGFAYQEKALAGEFHMIVPDRRGYGRSTRVESLGADFCWQAAEDMFALLDAVKAPDTYVWGHSDGAVIGAMQELTRRIRNARFSLYAQAGHCVHDGRLTRVTCTQEARDHMLAIELDRRPTARMRS